MVTKFTAERNFGVTDGGSGGGDDDDQRRERKGGQIFSSRLRSEKIFGGRAKAAPPFARDHTTLHEMMMVVMFDVLGRFVGGVQSLWPSLIFQLAQVQGVRGAKRKSKRFQLTLGFGKKICP